MYGGEGQAHVNLRQGKARFLPLYFCALCLGKGLHSI